MPSYPHIERYYQDKQRLLAYGGSDNDEDIRQARQQLCADFPDELDDLRATVASPYYNQPDRLVSQNCF